MLIVKERRLPRAIVASTFNTKRRQVIAVGSAASAKERQPATYGDLTVRSANSNAVPAVSGCGVSCASIKLPSTKVNNAGSSKPQPIAVEMVTVTVLQQCWPQLLQRTVHRQAAGRPRSKCHKLKGCNGRGLRTETIVVHTKYQQKVEDVVHRQQHARQRRRNLMFGQLEVRSIRRGGPFKTSKSHRMIV